MTEQLLTRVSKTRQSHANLNNSVLLAGLSSEELHNIINAGRWLEIAQGDHVYLQGDNDQQFYMIESGRVELLLDAGSSGRLSVSQIGPGGHFGETSLLTLAGVGVNDLTHNGRCSTRTISHRILVPRRKRRRPTRHARCRIERDKKLLAS